MIIIFTQKNDTIEEIENPHWEADTEDMEEETQN